MHMVSMEINTAHRLLHQPETPVKEPESESMLGGKKCSAALVVNTNFIKFLNGLSPDSFCFCDALHFEPDLPRVQEVYRFHIAPGW